jgi:outer membrane immunogenic protein
MRKIMLLATAFLSTGLMAASGEAAPFQGPYVGLEAGISRDKVGGSATDFGHDGRDHGKSGFSGGVFAGYDATIAPRVVVGGELTLDATAGDSITGGAGTEAAVLDPKRQISVTGRAGYLVSPQTLVYVRGGYTNVRADISSSAFSHTSAVSHDLDGWTLGAGVQRQLSSTISARVEYRYSDLGRGNRDFDRHQVLAAVAYHF